MRLLEGTYFDTFLPKILILIMAVSFGLALSSCEDGYKTEDADLSEEFTTAPIIDEDEELGELEPDEPSMQLPESSGVFGGPTFELPATLLSDQLTIDTEGGFKKRMKRILRAGVNRFEKFVLARMHEGPLEPEDMQNIAIDAQSKAQGYPGNLKPKISRFYEKLGEDDELADLLTMGELKLLHLAFMSLFQNAPDYLLATMGLHTHCVVGRRADINPGDVLILDSDSDSVRSGAKDSCSYRYGYLNTRIYDKCRREKNVGGSPRHVRVDVPCNPCRSDLVQDQCGYIGTVAYKMVRGLDKYAYKEQNVVVFTPHDQLRETANMAMSRVLGEMKAATGPLTEPMLALNRVIVTGSEDPAQNPFANLIAEYECLRGEDSNLIARLEYAYRWNIGRVIVAMMYMGDFVDREGAINYFMTHFLESSVPIGCIDDPQYPDKWRVALNSYFDAIDAQLATMK